MHLLRGSLSGTGRAVWLALGLLASLPSGLRADGPPLRAADLGLMLRSGYTSTEVLQEVTTRHVVDPLDPAAEKALRAAGADQRLIEALQSGRFTLAAGAAAEATRRQEALQAQLEADRAAGQDRLLAQAQAQAQAAVSRKLANLLRGKLVIWKDGRLQRYDDNVLSTKKVFAFYYSASWCPPCQKFTPKLVQFYQQFAAGHPDFEVIFISADRSADEMEKYMQAVAMPWPALEFDRKAAEPELTRYAGPGIPCLVLLDGAGGVHSDSYNGGKYLGPMHVLADLASMAGLKLVDDQAQRFAPDRADQPPVQRTSVSLAGQRQ